jgi:flagellar basal-body rod protein FlgF
MSSYGLWLSAAGMQVNEYRQNVVANNVANINTTGFKHELAIVRQRRLETESNASALPYVHPIYEEMSGGLVAQPTYTSFEQGAIEDTGRALDVAIDGEGFFTVSDGSNTRYTRDGVFTVNPEGELVLSAGGGRWRVLDAGGYPIRLDRGGADIQVSDNGTVRQGDDEVGQIGLVTHDNLQSLRKAGENLFENQAGEMKPASGRTIGGALEHSTFDMVTGLAAMIEASRAYEFNATLIQLQDHAIGQAVTRVGRAV